MKISTFFCCVCVFLTQISIAYSEDIRYCYIKDPAKHASNQALLSNILEEELKSFAQESPSEQASHLTSRIMPIAKKLLKNGFQTDAYDVPEGVQDSILAFYSFPLWEGNSLPLTFFVYIWPSEDLALHYNASQSRYGTVIHSHPIPCAFTVLDGVLTQNTYELASGRAVRFINEERFQEGTGDIDDLQKSFIHKLYNKDSKLSLSLHAYALSSAEKVRACFNETRSAYSYDNVIP